MFYINVPLGRHWGDYGTKDIQVLHYGIWLWRRILNGACISISNLPENIAWQTHRPEKRGLGRSPHLPPSIAAPSNQVQGRRGRVRAPVKKKNEVYKAESVLRKMAAGRKCQQHDTPLITSGPNEKKTFGHSRAPGRLSNRQTPLISNGFPIPPTALRFSVAWYRVVWRNVPHVSGDNYTYIFWLKLEAAFSPKASANC